MSEKTIRGKMKIELKTDSYVKIIAEHCIQVMKL